MVEYEIREAVDDLPFWPNPKSYAEAKRRAHKLSEKLGVSLGVWIVDEHGENFLGNT